MSDVKRYMIDPRDNIGLVAAGTQTLQFVLASAYEALEAELAAVKRVLAIFREDYENDPDVAGILSDAKALCNALQRIEAGEPEPQAIATEALELPARKHLYG